MARTDVGHYILVSFRHYMIVRRNDEVTAVPDTPITSVTQVATDVIRGTSLFGAIAFYLTRLPGPLAVKVPVVLVPIAVISSTLGVASLYPIVSILKTTWITARTLIDFLTANDGSCDCWFWAFVPSMFWPIYQRIKHLIVGQLPESASSHAGSHHSTGLSRSASRHSGAKSRTTQESDNDSNPPDIYNGKLKDRKFCGRFVYLYRNLDQPLTPKG